MTMKNWSNFISELTLSSLAKRKWKNNWPSWLFTGHHFWMLVKSNCHLNRWNSWTKKCKMSHHLMSKIKPRTII